MPFYAPHECQETLQPHTNSTVIKRRFFPHLHTTNSLDFIQDRVLLSIAHSTLVISSQLQALSEVVWEEVHICSMSKGKDYPGW